MTRGNNKNIVFKTDADYQYYLKLISRLKEELPFDLYHYCLMPNHVHMLIKTNRAADFSNFMKKLNLAYFHHFRKEYDWVGHFWQDRFRSQVVGKDNYFIHCGKYIELNPLRKGLVESPEKYQWSSYQHYFENKEDLLLTDDFLYEELGTTKEKRRLRYHELLIDELVSNNYKNTVWGSTPQKYNENRKINYHLPKRDFSKKRV